MTPERIQFLITSHTFYENKKEELENYSLNYIVTIQLRMVNSYIKYTLFELFGDLK